MELDEWQECWRKQSALLERAVAVDERVLQELVMGRVRRSLRPHVVRRILEAGCSVLVAYCAARSLASDSHGLVHLGVTILVLAFAVVMTGLLVTSAFRSAGLDCAAPVARIQQALARARRLDCRIEICAILGGSVVWLPLPLIVLETLTGVPLLDRVPLGWLLANVAFGLGLLGVGFLLEWRWVELDPDSAFARRIVDALSGRALRRAEEQVAELGNFVREPS